MIPAVRSPSPSTVDKNPPSPPTSPSVPATPPPAPQPPSNPHHPISLPTSDSHPLQSPRTNSATPRPDFEPHPSRRHALAGGPCDPKTAAKPTPLPATPSLSSACSARQKHRECTSRA